MSNRYVRIGLLVCGILCYSSFSFLPQTLADGTTSITFKKQVQKPGTSTYVDTLSPHDPRFRPNQQVSFKIIVTNNTDKKITNVQVVDTLPNYVSYVSGGKNYNQNSKEVNFTIDTLNPHQTNTQTLVTKISEEKLLPSDQGLICLTNTAKLSANGLTQTDDTQFCLEKEITSSSSKPIYPVPSISATPSTGVSFLSLISLIPTSLAGMVLKRKAKV